MATGWCVASLKHFDSQSLWTGAGLGALLAFNAFWAHRQDAGQSEQPLRAEPSFFTVLAFANWLATTWFNTSETNLPLALATEAVVLTFSIYLLRVREIALLGQFFLVFAQLAWLFHFLISHAAVVESAGHHRRHHRLEPLVAAPKNPRPSAGTFLFAARPCSRWRP